MGINYKDVGRVMEAIPLLEEVYEASKEKPGLDIFSPALLDAYVQAGDQPDKATKLMSEALETVRKETPAESPDLSGLLAQFSLISLEMKQFDKAELWLRECLAIREKNESGNWSTFNAQSMLGGALLGQNKYTEAGRLCGPERT